MAAPTWGPVAYQCQPGLVCAPPCWTSVVISVGVSKVGEGASGSVHRWTYTRRGWPIPAVIVAKVSSDRLRVLSGTMWPVPGSKVGAGLLAVPPPRAVARRAGLQVDPSSSEVRKTMSM